MPIVLHWKIHSRVFWKPQMPLKHITLYITFSFILCLCFLINVVEELVICFFLGHREQGSGHELAEYKISVSVSNEFQCLLETPSVCHS